MSALIRWTMKSLSMRSTRPVDCWSTPLMMPTGTDRTELVIAHLRPFWVRPSRMRWETRAEARIARSSVAASVTPVPCTSLMGMLRIADSCWICWPMPCTSTSLMPRLRSTAMSRSRLPKLSSATIAPSRAMTKIWPWNRGTYLRMPRRSVGLIVVMEEPLLIGMAMGFRRNAPPRQWGSAPPSAPGPRDRRRKSAGPHLTMKLPAPGRAAAAEGDVIPAGREALHREAHQHRALLRAREQLAGNALEIRQEKELALLAVEVRVTDLRRIVGLCAGELQRVGGGAAGRPRRLHAVDGVGQSRFGDQRAVQFGRQAAERIQNLGRQRRQPGRRQRLRRPLEAHRNPPVAQRQEALHRGLLAQVMVRLEARAALAIMEPQKAVARDEDHDRHHDPSEGQLPAVEAVVGEPVASAGGQDRGVGEGAIEEPVRQRRVVPGVAPEAGGFGQRGKVSCHGPRRLARRLEPFGIAASTGEPFHSQVREMPRQHEGRGGFAMGRQAKSSAPARRKASDPAASRFVGRRTIEQGRGELFRARRRPAAADMASRIEQHQGQRAEIPARARSAAGDSAINSNKVSPGRGRDAVCGARRQRRGPRSCRRRFPDSRPNQRPPARRRGSSP